MRVVAVGNPFRGDDAAGLEVARQLRGRIPPGVELVEREGEPAGLIEAMADAEAVWLVDAVSSGAPAGTLHRVDASEEPLSGEVFQASTHALGLADAVELARALGRLPRRVVVFGIEGRSFAAGEELTPEVQIAASEAAEAIRAEVQACTSAL